MNDKISSTQSHWVAAFSHFLDIKRIFVLSGNINDRVLYAKSSQSVDCLNMNQFLLHFLTDHGYEMVAFYDSSDHFSIPDHSQNQLFNSLCNETISDDLDKCDHLVKQTSCPSVLILRFVSENEPTMFSLLKNVLRYLVTTGHPKNMVLCLFDQPDDVPSWLYQNYATVQTIDIGLPTEKDRLTFLLLISDQFYESAASSSGEEQLHIANFSRLTDGLRLTELDILQKISNHHQIRLDQYHQLVKHYKFGSQGTAWGKINKKTFADAEKLIKSRIKGQDEIIHAVMDTLKRASIGLSGHPGANLLNAPRAVLFFAGPTGVGKTEMAKSIADAFFGDRSQFFQLDMNEYSDISAESRLFGGFGENASDGCLIRQVSQYPASMIVFENIENAHANALDRLPKILSDGFIKSPKGNTIFFSESIIVLTSSIGSAQGKIGDKKYDFTETGFMPKYEIVQQLIRMTVEDHFKIKLKRPKLFHCLGDNIFVFDFIRGVVMPDIIQKMVDEVITSITQRIGLEVTYDASILETIHEAVLRKDVNGARGIANVIEHVLINPLSRFLFDYQEQMNDNVHITDIRRSSGQAFELYEIQIQDDTISHDIDLAGL